MQPQTLRLRGPLSVRACSFAVACVIMLSSVSRAQVRAELTFLEGGPLVVLEGQDGAITLPTTNGNTVVTASLRRVSHVSPDVLDQWQLWITNTGGHGQMPSVPRMDVHPIRYELIVPDAAATSGTTLFDRTNPTGPTDLQATRAVGGSVYGIRLGNFREPCSIREEPGQVVISVLDDRPPTFGYPSFSGPWGQSPHPDEDPLAATNHRHPGGYRFLWDVFRTTPAGAGWIDVDPVVFPFPVFFDFANSIPPSMRAARPPRYQALLDSLGRQYPNHVETGPRSLLWYCTQGEARWRTFNHSPEVFKLPSGTQHLHWMSGLDPWWSDGHYLFQNNSIYGLFRYWLETQNQMAWFILNNWARYQLTSAICWTDPALVPGMNPNHDFYGWAFYEKSRRGTTNRTEPGRQFYPTNYKQPGAGILASAAIYAEIFGYEWAIEARDVWLDAVKFMKYENWNGTFGSRIGGYGLRNIVMAYRYTGQEDYRLQAIAAADNIMTLFQDPARIARETAWHGNQWVHPILGVAYLDNPSNGAAWTTSPPAAHGQSYKWNLFGNAAVARGLMDVAIYCLWDDPAKKTLLENKIRQMADFWVDQCLYVGSDIVLNLSGGQGGGMSTPRVPAFTKNANNLWNGPDTTNFTMPYVAPVIGYAAEVLGSAPCQQVFPLIYQRYGETLDWNPQVSFEFWEGTCTVSPSDLHVTCSTDLTGVDPAKHLIRVAWSDANGAEVGSDLLTLVSVNGNVAVASAISSELQTAIAQGYALTFIVTGPFRDKIFSAADKAIKNVVIPPTLATRPDPSRPFDWMDGHHFDSWIKMVAPMLWHGDEVAFFYKMYQNRTGQ